MKIVDVSAFYSPFGGGVKTYVERKLEIAPTLGHDLSIIVPSDRNEVEVFGNRARLIHLKSPQLIVDKRYRYFEAAAPVHELLDRACPDFVEASSPWRTASIVADWHGMAGRALIMHADPLSTYAYRWFGQIASRDKIDRQFDFFWRHLRRASSKFDMTIAASQGLATRLAAGGVARVATEPMGIDTGVFSPGMRDLELRRDLLARCNLPPTATLLLGVGRHSAEKRWPMIVEACEVAARNSPIGLIIIGDGRQRAQLARSIRGNPHIQLFSPVRDRALLARVYASADALVHGCETETFGLVAAEGAASGLPLIVPDEGGAADMVERGAGATYRAGDTAAAAAAISAFIGGDRPAAEQRARCHATNVPTIDGHFERLFSRYEITLRNFSQAA
jgi:alpha-1,6-mannosyltransferase